MPPRGLRSHLTGSVPVSIVVHLIVLLVLVVIPLVDIVLPRPAMMMPSYVFAAPLPPPPPVAPPTGSPSASVRPSPGAPTSMPPAITPERPAADPAVMTGDVTGELPTGLGITGGIATPIPPPQPVEVPRPLPGPVRAAQLPEMPRKLVDVHPVYPEVARAARVEGTVVLEAVLDTSGRITQLRVLKSVPLLDQAALDAVRQWRYTPSLYGGRPVSVLMTVTVRFTLQP